MITNRQLRLKAWNALRSKWNVFYPIMLFSVIFADAFGLKIVYANFFSTTISYPVTFLGMHYSYPLLIPRGPGVYMACAALFFTLCGTAVTIGEYILAEKVMNNDRLSLGTLFQLRVFLKAIFMNIIKYLIIMLGSMFLIIPGIVFACNYAEADYLLAKDPKLGPIEALRLSREKMRGKRLPYFSLQLSFMPWVFVIYLLMNLVAALVTNLTWSGDLIYSIFSWATGAFLLGYIRVTSFVFFRDTENFDYAEAVRQAFDEVHQRSEENKAKQEEAARHAEELRANEAAAEKLYLGNHCSHNALRKADLIDRYETLGLSAYREAQLRKQYAQELMRRFDTDPTALDDLLPFCEEYSIDDITDRIVARIYRYEWEGVVDGAAVLSMCLRVLGLLHSGAFDKDPGFAMRKQADLLKIVDTVKRKNEVIDPEGAWRDCYNRICDMCGIE